MLTKLRRVVATALIAASLALGSFPAPTLAAGTDTSHPCQNDNSTHQRFLFQNLKAGGERADSASADILVHFVWTCSIGDSISAVLPVNLENFSQPGFIAQLGYGMSDAGPNTNGHNKWLWTPNVCSTPIPGAAAIVPGWPDPIDGHTYRLTIKYITSSSRWRAYMDDYNDGLGNPIGAWYDDGECAVWSDLVWSGFESHDMGDMLGSSIWTPITNLTYETQGTTLNTYWTDGSNGFVGQFAPWHHSEVYNSPSPRDAIRMYTS